MLTGASSLPQYPPLHAYTCGQTLTSHPTLFFAAQWFSPTGLQDIPAIISKYADIKGVLPGNIPKEAISTWDWRNRFAVLRSDLRRTSGGRVEEIFNFMQAIANRLSMMLNQELIPSAFGSDTWAYRKEVEKLYLTKMMTWGNGDPVAKADFLWRYYKEVRQEAMFWIQPILPDNFREMKRGNVPFFANVVRFERKARAKFGYFFAYQMVEAAQLRRRSLNNRYVRVPGWWHDYEVPQGFWAELGAVYTYLGSHLLDPSSGLWTIFLTEWCVHVAANLVWDAHDQWRLWCLPKKLIEKMKKLDYSIPLGNAETNAEVHHLLREIEGVAWNNVSFRNRSREAPPSRLLASPGREHPSSGDYVWYSPISGCVCTRIQAHVGRLPVDSGGSRRDIPVTPADSAAMANPASAQHVDVDLDAESELHPSDFRTDEAVVRSTALEVPVSDQHMQEDNITAIVKTPTPIVQTPNPAIKFLSRSVPAAAGNDSGSCVAPSSTPEVTSSVAATPGTTACLASTPVQAQPRPAAATATISRATTNIHLRSVAVPIKKAKLLKRTVKGKGCLLSCDATMSPVPETTETSVEQDGLVTTATEATVAVIPAGDARKPSASDEPAVDSVIPSSGKVISTSMTFQQGLAEAIRVGLRRMGVPEPVLTSASLEDLRLLANLYGRSQI